ncbi:MAG: hypothetical protein R6U94_07060 [Nitriliruptoraceae bacterium]
MADTDRTSRRREPGTPKGRPTPGRKQRNAAARARVRREQLLMRLMWVGGAVVAIGLIAVLVATGVGAGTGGHSLP